MEYITELWNREEKNLIVRELNVRPLICDEPTKCYTYTIPIEKISQIRRKIEQSNLLFENIELGQPKYLVRDGSSEEIVVKFGDKKACFNGSNLLTEYQDSEPDTRAGQLVELCELIFKTATEYDETVVPNYPI